MPLITIIESLQLKAGMINRVAGQGEVFWFRDGYVPVVRLHEVFGVKPRTTQLHEGLIMVVEGEGRRVGLFVDDLLGQQQVVIKSLETNFRRVDGVSGATILGDGAVALILDVPGLIRVGIAARGGLSALNSQQDMCRFASLRNRHEHAANISVKAKLFATLALAGVVMIVVGGLGLSGTMSSNADLDAIFAESLHADRLGRRRSSRTSARCSRKRKTSSSVRMRRP